MQVFGVEAFGEPEAASVVIVVVVRVRERRIPKSTKAIQTTKKARRNLAFPLLYLYGSLTTTCCDSLPNSEAVRSNRAGGIRKNADLGRNRGRGLPRLSLFAEATRDPTFSRLPVGRLLTCVLG